MQEGCKCVKSGYSKALRKGLNNRGNTNKTENKEGEYIQGKHGILLTLNYIQTATIWQFLSGKSPRFPLSTHTPIQAEESKQLIQPLPFHTKS